MLICFKKKINVFKSKFILQEINMTQYVIRSTVLCTRLIGHQFKANDIILYLLLCVVSINMNILIIVI